MRAALLAGLLCAAALPARADDKACERQITVTGRAEAARAPDFAEVTLGVEAKAPGPAAALDAASRAVDGVIALGRQLGVPASDIGTSAVTLEAASRPVTRPNGATTAEPDGYRATNTVTVRLADMERLGDLLRRALDVGANRIDAVGFGLNEPDRIQAELEIAAAKDARTRAAALAEAAGAKLGPLCSLSTGGGPQPLRMAAPARAKAASGRRVPISAGTIDTRADVTAAFAILP
ncbi:SIMPL domain-containing protein [Methylobacterium sp. NEAU 140]|uniref:SIMPL domain-containing protein n=1 Tax=Methylobacterium sp. NEAU 140 TaxID=3064945 RepID=UPI00273721DB|nr:SIMPL domain-containing protein [Methylobacterium sp. NEAU 140]MDP4021442.1 SIMPL domain-containing protein [Methylobacterium sp. NEAU 140]